MMQPVSKNRDMYLTLLGVYKSVEETTRTQLYVIRVCPIARTRCASTKLTIQWLQFF